MIRRGAAEYRIVNLDAGLPGGDLLLGAILPDNGITGFLCYGCDGMVARIRYIFVAKSMRRQGIGTALLQSLSDIMMLSPGAINPLEAYFTEDEEHEDVKLFFEAQNNFVAERIGAAYRYNEHSRLISQQWLRLVVEKSGGVPFFSLSRRVRNGFTLKYGIGMDGLLSFDDRLCFCSVRNDEITGAVFAGILPTGEVTVYLTAGEPGGIRSALSAFAKRVEELFPDRDLLVINCDRTGEVISLFGKSRELVSVIIVRWNYMSEVQTAVYGEAKPGLR